MKIDSKKPRGRPQSYDLNEVLDAAVGVFWTNGYEGASMDDLTGAMGINRPSLYAKFGNKHGLFLAALDRYIETNSTAQSLPLMQESDLRAAIEGYYREIIRTVTSEDGPKGCLIACVATEISERDEAVREKISTLLGQAETLLDERLANEGYGQKECGSDPSVTGAMIIAAGLGFAARARLGASRNELEKVANGFVESFFAANPKEPETLPAGDGS